MADRAADSAGGNAPTAAPLRKSCRQLAVAHGLSVGDAQERFPDREPKRRSLRAKRRQEARITSGEVETEPVRGLRKDRQRVRAARLGERVRKVTLPDKAERAQRRGVPGEDHRAERGFESAGSFHKSSSFGKKCRKHNSASAARWRNEGRRSRTPRRRPAKIQRRMICRRKKRERVWRPDFFGCISPAARI